MDKKETANQAVATALRLERAIADLTMEEVAARAGIAKSSYSRYESGERQITLQQTMQICEVFGISLTAFAKRVQERLQALQTKQTDKPSNVMRMPDRFVIDDTVQAAFDAPKPSDYENGEEDYSQDPDDYRK